MKNWQNKKIWIGYLKSDTDSDSILAHLIEHQHTVKIAKTTSDALELLKFIDIIVIEIDDFNNEFHIVRRLSKQNIIPVFCLLVNNNPIHRVEAFIEGAMDCQSAGCFPEELELRLLRLYEACGSSIEYYDNNVQIQSGRNLIRFNDSAYILTKIELKFMKLMLASNGSTVSRQFLLENVWLNRSVSTNRVIDTTVSILNKKIYEITIESVRGTGYKLTILNT